MKCLDIFVDYEFIRHRATLMRTVMIFCCGWSKRLAQKFHLCLELENLIMEGKILVIFYFFVVVMNPLSIKTKNYLFSLAITSFFFFYWAGFFLLV